LLLISQNALGDVAEVAEVAEVTETPDVDDLIHDRCGNGDLAGVKQLAATYGTERVVETGLQYGITCLHQASVGGDSPDLILYLLEHDADPNRQDPGGETPLGWATAFCRLSNVKTLLDHVAYVKEEITKALHQFCNGEDEDKQREMARILLQHGADPNAKHPWWDRTPFMNAVFNADIGAIREMAKWMEKEQTQVKKEDVKPYKQHLFDDIVKAISEGQNDREMLRALSTPAPAKAESRLLLPWR